MAKGQKGQLIDDHVSVEQCKKALAALTTHALKKQKKQEDTELLPGREENIWLVLTVKKTQPEKKLKPFRIPLAHPAVDPRTTSVCLITKDPQREYKDLLESHKIKFISRVVGITKLKGKFKPFEARRMLLKENGFFLADERVVPLLPGLLGKIFFEAKKQPIPVCLTRKDLKGELEHAISSAYMHQNKGTCTSIKIGTVSHTPAQLLENLQSALPAIASHIHGGWDNIQSFNIKTNSSISLPIWTCDLGEGDSARWGGVGVAEGVVDEEPGGLGGDDGGSGDSEGEGDSDAIRKAKGKRRAVDVDEVGLPSKQTKKLKQSDTEAKSNKRSKRPLQLPESEGRKKGVDGDGKKEREAVRNSVRDADKLASPRPEKKAKESNRKNPTEISSKGGELSISKKETTLTAKADKSSALRTKISVGELKKKWSDSGIEKKKAAALKGKGKRTAKDQIVGGAVRSRT